jgi:type IV pilus assembly protein PilA
MKKQQGFTLIELMIVVAIIAILAAIAIPAYRDYLIRTQVSEGASLTGAAKVAVDEYYANYGVAPTTNGQAGLATNTDIKGDYVSQVTVGAAGAIEAKFSGGKANSAITGKILVFTPTFNNGSTSWSCTATTNIDDKYLPTSCR